MKFISKLSNYRVILRPGQPGSRMTGVLAVPGISVWFDGGIAEVKNEEHVKMMLELPAFKNGDFIIDKDGKDPFFNSRKNIEPAHNIAEMEYGSVGKAVNPKPLVEISEVQKEVISKMATEMATKMYTDMVEKDKIDVEEVGEPASVATVAEPPVTEIKNPKTIAPEPIEDTSSMYIPQESVPAETMQVDRVDVKDVKVELKADDGTPIVKAKHAPRASTAAYDPKSFMKDVNNKIKNKK